MASPAILGALEAIGLAVDAGERALLRGVPFRVESGETLAILGPSGAGKTTLLRAVATLGPLRAGELRLDGDDPATVGWPQWRRALVLVTQRPVLLPATVEDNLRQAFQLATAGTDRFDLERALRLFDRLALPRTRMARPARELSVGEQQRVCLVRALIVARRGLLLDEPTSALDSASMGATEALLAEEIAARGLCCLLVTHDLDQARRLGARDLDLGGWLVTEEGADGR